MTRRPPPSRWRGGCVPPSSGANEWLFLPSSSVQWNESFLSTEEYVSYTLRRACLSSAPAVEHNRAQVSAKASRDRLRPLPRGRRDVAHPSPRAERDRWISRSQSGGTGAVEGAGECCRHP